MAKVREGLELISDPITPTQKLINLKIAYERDKAAGKMTPELHQQYKKAGDWLRSLGASEAEANQTVYGSVYGSQQPKRPLIPSSLDPTQYAGPYQAGIHAGPGTRILGGGLETHPLAQARATGPVRIGGGFPLGRSSTPDYSKTTVESHVFQGEAPAQREFRRQADTASFPFSRPQPQSTQPSQARQARPELLQSKWEINPNPVTLTDKLVNLKIAYERDKAAGKMTPELHQQYKRVGDWLRSLGASEAEANMRVYGSSYGASPPSRSPIQIQPQPIQPQPTQPVQTAPTPTQPASTQPTPNNIEQAQQSLPNTPPPVEKQPELTLSTLTEQLVQSKPDSSADPEIHAVYLQAAQDILKMIDEEEARLKAQAEEEMKTIDPATQELLEDLRKRLEESIKATREDLNRRGLLESGILLDLEQKLRSGELNARAKILADRLNRIKQNLYSSLTKLAEQRFGIVKEYGLKGLAALEEERKRKEERPFEEAKLLGRYMPVEGKSLIEQIVKLKAEAEQPGKWTADDIKRMSQEADRLRFELSKYIGADAYTLFGPQVTARQAAANAALAGIPTLEERKQALAEQREADSFALGLERLALENRRLNIEEAYWQAILKRDAQRLAQEADMNNWRKLRDLTEDAIRTNTNYVVRAITSAPDITTAYDYLSGALPPPGYSHEEWQAVLDSADMRQAFSAMKTRFPEEFASSNPYLSYLLGGQ